MIWLNLVCFTIEGHPLVKPWVPVHQHIGGSLPMTTTYNL